MVARVRGTAALASVPAVPATGGSAVPDPTEEYRNEVIIAGRLAAAALAKQLPSGDQIVTWRLLVDRALTAGPRKVDVIDCTAFSAKVRRQALVWADGEVIEVTGALRRRFWRGPTGLQSRCEVEVGTAVRRTSAAARRRAVAAAAVKRPREPG